MLTMIRAGTFTGVMFFALSASNAIAADELKLEDETARINYSLGYQIGGDFKRQNIEMNAAAVIRGIEDAISGGQPLLSRDQMHTTLVELKRKVTDIERKEKRKSSYENELKNIGDGKKFMEENSKKPGVVTTASGLQYEIIKQGSGKAPGPKDEVTVNYRAMQLNGREFDSSFKRGKPSTLNLSAVVKGLKEGMQFVKEGGRIRLFIPHKLAYRDRGPLAHKTLIYEIELLSVTEAQASASANK